MTGFAENEKEKALEKAKKLKYDKSDRKGTAPMLGGASIIVVFAVLCLTIFAVLTLITAQSEYRISEASVSSVDSYYKADAEAVAFTAELKRLFKEDKNTEALKDAALQCGADEVRSEEDCIVIGKTFPIDKNQALFVTLAAENGTVHVRGWQTVYCGEWDNEQGMELWNGVSETVG